MRNAEFWEYFDGFAAPRLGKREISFRKMFQYLDGIEGPLTIVETGCARLADNWGGDGQSTVMFDKYLGFGREGSIGHTVDLDAKATALCKSLVSPRFEVHTGDSVKVLTQIARSLKAQGRTIDLLYLDSYDLDWNNPTPSAVHHLKEMVSIVGMIRPDTLVVIDDAASTCLVVAGANNQMQMISRPAIGGKGGFVAEYAQQVGATTLFAHYQVGWTGMVGGA